KALAPAGARLTPMLAITAQGFLFSLAVGLLGTRWVGLCFGATLLAFWAVIQPIALGLIVFGASAVRAAEWLRQMVSSDLAIWGWWVFGGLIGLKVLLANLLVVVAVKASSSSWGRFEEKLTSVQLERRSRNNVWPAIWWLVSGALLVTFSIVVEARAVATVWLLLRIGAGVLFVFWLRALLKEARVQRWILNRYPDLAHVLREVTGISRPN
ncbi:MAG TPA: hypothetical protein PLH57_10420, partial [Oligoflexia bacterium]|nr:hypothetical protein [Oligoflexia bacterium]